MLESIATQSSLDRDKGTLSHRVRPLDPPLVGYRASAGVAVASLFWFVFFENQANQPFVIEGNFRDATYSLPVHSADKR